jgi:glycosyltransferase involved in cell wall biosynthesis
MISLVIPSRNNLKYVKTAYHSIRKHIGHDVEIILLDDASTDETWSWMDHLYFHKDENVKIYRNTGPERVGHTVLYDIGADLATNEIFGIFHADMIATPNYVKNMVKHLKRGTVVSATRIEPPLHPPGPEKYVADFGLEPEEFKEEDFLRFVDAAENGSGNKDKTTNGIFAPWMMYVEDFKAIGGHDKRVFAPMELEDSDLFNRFLLKGYNLIQSRDAFLYHMTCRGSRFKDGVKIVQEIPLGEGRVWKRPQDSEEYIKLRQIKFREWWRKWHMDVLHDSNMLPIVHPRYDMGFVIKNANIDVIRYFEPWCDNLYVDAWVEQYISEEQQNTKFNLSMRVKQMSSPKLNAILVEFDARNLHQEHLEIIKQLPLMIKDSGESGIMEFDIFKLDIALINEIQSRFIDADNPWYVKQLI